MTEKKSIIIDNIDVSKCECSSQIDLDMNIICISNSPNKKSGYCKDNINCYFKQLARKTKECEKLEEENFTFEQLIKEYEKYGAIEEIIQQLDQLKTENEILKKKTQTNNRRGE